MTDDEKCGYEDTTTGQPCRHPAGSCPVPTHSEAAPDGGNPQGRPSKFDDDRAQAALEAARESKSEAGCARAAGVAKGTLHNWKEENPTFTGEDGQEREFLNAFTRARAEGESMLIDGGLREEDVDSSMAKFLLASSFDYQKSEKREVTGGGGGPIEITFTEEVVETEWGDGE